MAILLRSYLRVLEKHPLLTMSCTTGTLMATGDAISQTVVERTGKFDLVRNGRFLVFGVFIGGPLFRGWYFSIDKIFGKTKYAPMKMMLADQGLFAPVFLPFFLFTMGVMRQDPVHEIAEKVKKDYYDVMTTNWKIWPAAQIINFTFVPLQHRVLFVNFVALFWNTYLAWKSEAAHRRQSSDTESLRLKTFAHIIMVVNLVSVGWNCYMAWISEKEHEDVVLHHHPPTEQKIHNHPQTEQKIHTKTSIPKSSLASCSNKER